MFQSAGLDEEISVEFYSRSGSYLTKVPGIKYGNCCRACGSVFEEIVYAGLDASMHVFLSEDGIKAIVFRSFYNTAIGMRCFCGGAVGLMCERRGLNCCICIRLLPIDNTR